LLSTPREAGPPSSGASAAAASVFVSTKAERCGTKQRQLDFLWHLAGNARSPGADRIHALQWIEIIACHDRAARVWSSGDIA
jgi:hypothetical protein